MKAFTNHLIVLSVALAVFVGTCSRGGSGDAQADAGAPPAGGEAHASRKIRVGRSSDGHFYLPATIRGRSLRFLVDTGASTVALGRDDARAAGLSLDADDFDGLASTANGTVPVAHVTLDRMVIDGRTVEHVPAMVMDEAHVMPLLGQSALRRFDVSIRDDELTLTPL